MGFHIPKIWQILKYFSGALKIEHHKPIIISEERSSISTFFFAFYPTYLDFSFLEEKNFLDNVDGEAKQS